MNLFEALWRKHYAAGATGSYHGDMALAFAKIRQDELCDGTIAQMLMNAVRVHCRLERMPEHVGRKWFCEQFGTEQERLTA